MSHDIKPILVLGIKIHLSKVTYDMSDKFFLTYFNMVSKIAYE